MKNILITWTSKWIGNYLFKNLETNNSIYSISWKNEVDLRKKNDIDIFCKKTNDKEIIFDLLILNAWIWEFWKFEDNDIDKYEDIINLNLLANIRLLKWLKNSINKNTKIIFIWSIISKKFMKNAAVYQASKFGLRWFAWGLKNEWKKVFLINPKIVATWFHENKIELDKRFTQTKLEDILLVITNIIIWKETRFEIDL